MSPASQKLERQIETALWPDQFVCWRDSSDFVEGLEELRALVETLPPKDAVRLFETFLAGCAAKAEEIDGSSGSFGDFVQSLVCCWVKARRAAGFEPAETARTLLRWKDKDQYGFFHNIERELAESFNRVERAAFTAAACERFDEALKKAGGPGCPHPYYDAPHPLREAADMLKTLYEAGRDAQAYAGLCGVMGTSPKDCERMARILQRRGKLEPALEWVERGSQAELRKAWPNQDAGELADIKRELLKGLGRHGEALEQAWTEFNAHPGEYSYADLMGCVPPRDRTAWHEKAMAAAEKASLDACIDLYVKTRAWPRLAARVDRAGDEELRGIYYSRAIEAAKKLAKEHPAQAAALYRGQALQILDGKKSRLYEAALRYFSEARRCYEAAGQGEQWRRLADGVLLEHARKYTFLPKFQRLAAGEKIKREPSFLTRAKRRWKGSCADAGMDADDTGHGPGDEGLK